MLVMEMSSKKHTIPAIRFIGFTNAWEQRKASEIFVSISDKNHPELPILSASQEKGMVLREDIGIDIKYDEKSVGTYKRVAPGQFVIHLRSFQGGFAYSSIEGITSPAYTILDFEKRNEQYSLFWRSVFSSRYFIKRLETVTYGIRDGRSISYADFSTLIFRVPSISEQKRIGDFLVSINSAIAIHQRQLDNYKILKSAMIQKIFKREMRFKDQEGNNYPKWEKYRLGELITEYNEKTKINNQYPPLTSSRRGLFLQEDYFNKQIASRDTTGYNIVPFGYFTYRHMSDDLEFYFNINYLVPNGIVSTLYPVFTTKDNLDSNFLQIILNYGKEFKQFAILQKQGGSRTYMYLSKLKNLMLTIPCFLEQQKIANFVLALDKKISIEERQIELLQKQKDWFMQKLFL